MRRITLGLGLNLLLLSATATLLTNLVVLPFWINDAQVREADMVAEIAQAYAERSGAGTAGQSSASQLEPANILS